MKTLVRLALTIIQLFSWKSAGLKVSHNFFGRRPKEYLFFLTLRKLKKFELKGWQNEECPSVYKVNRTMYHMEMDFYSIYALVVFVSEYYVSTHFPWSNFYIYDSKMNENEWKFFDSAFTRPRMFV